MLLIVVLYSWTFLARDMQLLRYQKITETWMPLPTCSNLLNFGHPSPKNVQNFTSAPFHTPTGNYPL